MEILLFALGGYIAISIAVIIDKNNYIKYLEQRLEIEAENNLENLRS